MDWDDIDTTIRAVSHVFWLLFHITREFLAMYFKRNFTYNDRMHFKWDGAEPINFENIYSNYQ